MKTYVITFSKNYPITHPKKGELTEFIEKILDRIKTTTIRKNIYRWKKIQQEIENQEAVLSLRYWSGKPYRSKQVEFATCDSIWVKEIFISNDRRNGLEISLDDKYCYHDKIERIVKSEGFKTKDELQLWFKEPSFSGALIRINNLTIL